MTMQMKHNDRLLPHQWLDVQRASLIKERQTQRAQTFVKLGPSAGTDGSRMAELARSSSWSRWPHQQYGASWIPDPGKEQLARSASSTFEFKDDESVGFYQKWNQQKMPFPPLGVKPEDKYLGVASPNLGGSSGASSGASTPSGARSGVADWMRRPALDAPPTLCYKRVHEVEKPVATPSATGVSRTGFRSFDRAHPTAAAANTPKHWEIRKDWDAKQGWAGRSTKSAERLGLMP